VQRGCGRRDGGFARGWRWRKGRGRIRGGVGRGGDEGGKESL